MDIRKHWDRWGWAIPAVLILIGAARLFFGREPFCSAGDHCLREWVSALRGGAAVAAAVPTVMFLSKQVSDAERFSRITVQMNTIPTIEHAKHVSDHASMLLNSVRKSVGQLERLPSPDRTGDKVAITVALGVTVRLLDRVELHQAGSEFQALPGANVLVGMLKNDIESIERLKDPVREADIQKRLDSSRQTLQLVDIFCDKIVQKAAERVSRAEEILKTV